MERFIIITEMYKQTNGILALLKKSVRNTSQNQINFIITNGS